MRMHAHAASTAAKMHETRLIRKKQKKKKQNIFTLEEKSTVGEGKHFNGH